MPGTQLQWRLSVLRPAAIRLALCVSLLGRYGAVAAGLASAGLRPPPPQIGASFSSVRARWNVSCVTAGGLTDVPSFATTRQGRRYRAFTHVAWHALRSHIACELAVWMPSGMYGLIARSVALLEAPLIRGDRRTAASLRLPPHSKVPPSEVSRPMRCFMRLRWRQRWKR